MESVRYIYMKETETTLAKTISVAGVNAAYDNACKRILSDKNILAWIMKSCLPEYKTCSVDEIAANAVGDACTGSNPRAIDPATMAKLFKCTYYGTEVDF